MILTKRLAKEVILEELFDDDMVCVFQAEEGEVVYTISKWVDNNYELCNGISGECKIFDTIDQCIEYITRNGDVVA